MKKFLIEEVIYQIKRDFADGDTSCLEELLGFLPDDKLEGYLPDPEVRIIISDGFFCGE